MLKMWERLFLSGENWPPAPALGLLPLILVYVPAPDAGGQAVLQVLVVSPAV